MDQTTLIVPDRHADHASRGTGDTTAPGDGRGGDPPGTAPRPSGDRARPERLRPLARRGFRRILIVKPSALGDVVHALPVLHGLRSRYPAARIDWLVGAAFAPLIHGHPDLDGIVAFDRQRFARMARHPRVASAFASLLRDLRSRRYDLVVDLQGLFRSGFLTWTTGAPVRIGFARAREFAWMFYTHRIRPGDANMHAVDRNFRVADMLGFDDVPIEFRLTLRPEETTAAAALLRRVGVPPGSRVIAVAPGARWETKVWRPERFAETIDRLHGTQAPRLAPNAARCILLGSPAEIELCDRIARACRSAPANLAGRTSVRDMAAVLSLADVVLCHDSAAMHIAVALERAVVCLIGPTNPQRTGPYRRERDVLRVPLPCAPCYLRRLAQCRHDHRCMSDLSTDVVVNAVEHALTRTATSP